MNAPDAASPPRILVVDDNILNRKLADAYLTRLGWLVDECEDGEAALAFLRAMQAESAVEAVLLDISMPGMSGKDVCKLIRTDLGLQDLAVIAYTAHAMQEETLAILRCGFDDILIKPISFAGLQRCLETHCMRLPQPIPDWVVGEARPSAGREVKAGTRAARNGVVRPVGSVPRPENSGGPLLLIVDDHAVNRQLLQAQLHLEGWRCKGVENGIQALAWLAEHRPAAMIVDYTLTDMTGVELLRRWRDCEAELNPTRNAGSGVPALLYSGISMDILQAEALGLDCHAFISKPASREDLRKALQPLLERPQPEGSNEPDEPADPMLPAPHQHPLWDEFVELAQADLTLMRRGILSGDLSAVKRAAHSLRGAAGVLQAHEVSKLAAEIEGWKSLPTIPDGLAACEYLRQVIEDPKH